MSKVERDQRKFNSIEAKQFGLISRICKNSTELYQEALSVASTIASKSPVATQSVKTMLNYSRDHTLEDSMNFGLTWNTSFIQSNDTMIAGMAFMLHIKSKMSHKSGTLYLLTT